MTLRIENLRVPLAEFALELDLELNARCSVVFGPSGSGKTTLLDCIAGWRQPERGRIRLGEHPVFDAATGLNLPSRQRTVGYVPQDLALFPHLTVRNNLRYGLPAHPGEPDRWDRVGSVLELEPLLERRVPTLSGGERQRVALGRALLSEPRLLLLDEPLANLDTPRKQRILENLARVHEAFAVPILWVTHDRSETLGFADHMVVLDRGRLVQQGTPAEVFSRPASKDIAGLLAIETILPGRIHQQTGELFTVHVGSSTLHGIGADLPPDRADVHVCIRAEHVMVVKGPTGASSARNHLPGTVRSLIPAGPLTRVELDCGFPLTALLTSAACADLGLHPGDPVVALVKAPHVHLV